MARSGRTRWSPTLRSKMMAPATCGTTVGRGKPPPCSSWYARAPHTASRPKALLRRARYRPPWGRGDARSRNSMPFTRPPTRQSRARPPRADRGRMTVQPVSACRSVTWPTRIPGSSRTLANSGGARLVMLVSKVTCGGAHVLKTVWTEARSWRSAHAAALGADRRLSCCSPCWWRTVGSGWSTSRGDAARLQKELTASQGKSRDCACRPPWPTSAW